MEKEDNCCLCGKKFENQYDRNNAEPLANGDCCSDCNSEKVIPARMKEMGIG